MPFKIVGNDMTIKRGDSDVIDVLNLGVDLTDATVYMTVKENLSDTDEEALFQVEVTTHTDPTNGETAIPVSKTDTDHPAGDYYYDMQATLADGQVMTFYPPDPTVKDKLFHITEDVTKS